MTALQDIERSIVEIGQKAQIASRSLAALPSRDKDKILASVVDLLIENKAEIQSENRKDLESGKQKGLSDAMLDRLRLSDNVIDSMCQGVLEVAALPDPVGEVSHMVRRPNGLQVGRMRIPLGVIGMIYESRPNVTVDAAALCLKTGNSVILRGGSEAFYSNQILAQILQQALDSGGVDAHAVQVVPTTDRQAITSLLKQEEYIDLIIPRGGEGLIRFVSENSRIPVLKHYKGVCHIYVDEQANLAKATPIIINSKVQRPGVCNALEGLLIHKTHADNYLLELVSTLEREGVSLLGCTETVARCKTVQPAEDHDWGTEFLDLRLCIKVVDSLAEARSYIETYGSKHTETIITEDYTAAQEFINTIDASAVMVNASTRFNDGGQLGLGTEIGISTTKLHSYGPMGLAELTTQKFVVFGSGQVRD